MERLYVLSNSSYIHTMFSSDDVLVGKIVNSKIYFCAEKNKNPDYPEDFINVSWYYNNTDEPDLTDRVPFVDVLDLVNEEVSKELIFNIDLFLNKGA